MTRVLTIKSKTDQQRISKLLLYRSLLLFITKIYLISTIGFQILNQMQRDSLEQQFKMMTFQGYMISKLIKHALQLIKQKLIYNQFQVLSSIPFPNKVTLDHLHLKVQCQFRLKLYQEDIKALLKIVLEKHTRRHLLVAQNKSSSLKLKKI